MSAHDHHSDFEEPKPYSPSKGFFMIGGVLAALGTVAFLAALLAMGQPRRAWQAYLIGFWFTLGLGLAGPFIMAINYAAQAGWWVSIRRILEAFSWYLGPAAIFGIIALLGADSLFPWLGDHGDMPHHVAHILELKSGFLNMTGMTIATVASLLLFVGFAYWLQYNSRKQDETADPALTERNKVISIVFLAVFVFGFSLLCWYWLMSLAPLWFSTMWQVHAFAGLFQSGLALLAIVTITINRGGYFGDFVNDEQILAIGQMIFGFTVFYAYITFCEFMLIWYANIPEETFWFVQRTDALGTWGFFIALFAVKFIIPFFALLPQAIKKNKGNMLYYISGLLLVAQLYEIWYWVGFAPDSADPHAVATIAVPWLEVLVTCGFIGVFMLTAGWAISRAKIIPVNDPYLHECLPHHHGEHDLHPEDEESLSKLDHKVSHPET